MAFFVIIIIPNLVQTLCRTAQTIPSLIIVLFGLNQLGDIDSGGRSRVFLASSTLLLSSATVVLLLSSLSGRLRVTRAESWQFWSPDLGLFLTRVFYQLALDTGLGRSRVGWPGVLRTVLVHIFSGGLRP